jgi:hypothetical protein
VNKKLKIVSASGGLVALAWFSRLLNLNPLIFNTSMIIASIIAGYQVAISANNT